MTSSVKSGVSAWKPPIPVGGSKPAAAGLFTRLGRTFGRFFGRIGRLFMRIPLLNKLPMLIGSMATGAFKIAMLLGKFTLVGAIITAIVGSVYTVFQVVSQNVMNIREFTTAWVDQLHARFAVVWDIVKPMVTAIGKVFSADGPIGKFFAVVLMGLINTIGTAVDGIMLLVQTLILTISKAIESPSKLLSPLELLTEAAFEAQARTQKKYEQIQFDRIDAASRATDKGRLATAPGVRPPQPIMDFRGSKFDIKQQFAEGFDPDRIAVAFSNDLATLGERRVQSGLAPLFAVR